MLGAIVAAARTMVVTRRQAEPQARLKIRAARRQPAGSAFREALSRPGRLNIIAECKRRSPSRGVLCATYDPAAIARSYQRGGAAAVSVLTEPTFFDGALAHLERVREAIRCRCCARISSLRSINCSKPVPVEPMRSC